VTDADSAIRDLEAALRAVQAEQRATRRGVEDLAVDMGRLATRREVEDLAAGIERLATGLDDFRAQFAAFVKEDRRARHLERAHTALIDVRAQRDRQFGHYVTVRRGTMGMLLAMDAGVVNAHDLQQAASQKMIDTPGYWLAPVQVALAAWISNNEKLATAALTEAMTRAPNKTALFFSLVLARHERYEATAKWMREYVRRQNPGALSREFTVVLDAVAQQALGLPAYQLVREHCATWSEQLRSDESIASEQIRRWRHRLSRNTRRLSGQFTVLPAMCPDWARVAGWLDAATVHDQTERWLRGRLETASPRIDDARRRVDEVLNNLVTAYDEEEDSLRREEREWMAVIEAEGDVLRVEQILEDAAPADEPVSDFLTLLTTIATIPGAAGSSPATQQMAISLSDPWISAAAKELSVQSRRDNPGSVTVAIGEWRGQFTAQGADDELAGEFIAFVDGEVRVKVGQVTARKPASVCALLLAVLAFILGGTLSRWWVPSVTAFIAVGVALLLLMMCLVWLLRARRDLPERRETVRERGETRKEEGLTNLQRAARESRQVFQLWHSELAKEESLLTFIQEQAVWADPLTLMAAESENPPRGPADASGRPSRPETGLSDDANQSDDQWFPFTLPNWDLEPPSLHGG
jgi:hypothetical protein